MFPLWRTITTDIIKSKSPTRPLVVRGAAVFELQADMTALKIVKIIYSVCYDVHNP